MSTGFFEKDDRIPFPNELRAAPTECTEEDPDGIGPILIKPVTTEDSDFFLDLRPCLPPEMYEDVGVDPPFKTYADAKRAGCDEATAQRYVKRGHVTPHSWLSQPVGQLAFQDKFLLALNLSQTHLSGEARAAMEGLLAPENMGMVAGAVGLWAAGHYFGISEVVDAILLGAGLATSGFAVMQAHEDLYQFVSMMERASRVQHVRDASQYLARFIVHVGIDAFIAMVFKCGGGQAAGKTAKYLQRQGNKRLASRWPKIPDGYVLPPDIKFGTPSEPMVILSPKARELGGMSSVESAARKLGMTANELEQALVVATRHGVEIHIRPASPASAALRARGGLPKSVDIKSNTINQIDVLLGAPADALHTVGHFKPQQTLDDILRKAPASQHSAIRARYKKRVEIFNATDAAMQRKVNAGEFKIEPGGVVVHVGTGKRITSDLDLMGIRLSSNGSNLKPGDIRFHRVQNDLEIGPFWAQHQPHRTWKPHGSFEEKVFWDIMVRHSYNEPVGVVRPGGIVSLEYTELPNFFLR